MPLYECEVLADGVPTGERCEVFRPVALRDDLPPNLRRVISNVAVFGARVPDTDPMHTVDYAVPKALRELESKHGTEHVRRGLDGFAIERMPRVWDFKQSFRY